MANRVIIPMEPEALQREGLQATPQVWEDGLRADPRPGNFEWWYFDAQMEDGSTVVVVFFTKTMLDRRSRLKPGVSVSITRPDGHKLSQVSLVDPKDFSASKERCSVRAGESFVRGDLVEYELHAKAGDLAAQLRLTAVVPAWRPGVSKNYYDEARTRSFAWFPAIPYGRVEGHLMYDGKLHPVKGACYHDHNWGNVGLNDVLSHWYWGRAHIGDYTLIFAEMTASPRFNGQKIPVFMLAKGSQVLAGAGGTLEVREQDFVADPGGRSYPDGLDLDWQQGPCQVSMKLRAPALIDSFSLLEALPAWQRVIGKLVANPYYFRFKADLVVQIDLCVRSAGSEENIHTRVEGPAMYELVLLR